MFGVAAAARSFVRRRWSGVLALLFALTGCSLSFAPAELPAPAFEGPPVVQIVSPPANATFREGVTVQVQALISNAGPDIDRVEVAIGTTIIATLANPNEDGAPAFSIAQGWPAASPGLYEATVTAFRADGSSSAPASVAFTVIEAAEATDEPLETPATAEAGPPQATATPRPTREPVAPPADPTQPPAPPPTPTASTPTASFAQSINVRRGPGTIFAPPIGSFAAGQTTEILAVNPARDWYKVRYLGGEGWVFAGLTTVSGDISTLPVDPGPPVPTAPPATAVPPPVVQPVDPVAPPPPAGGSQANLVAGIVELTPGQPQCNQTFQIGFDVANLGSEPTARSGTVLVQSIHVGTGQVQQETIGGFPVLQPGETFRVVMFLTVSTYFNEEHRLVLTIDPNNEIPETETGDNRRELTYILQQGSAC
jgi:hypothetical protein